MSMSDGVCVTSSWRGARNPLSRHVIKLRPFPPRCSQHAEFLVDSLALAIWGPAFPTWVCKSIDAHGKLFGDSQNDFSRGGGGCASSSSLRYCVAARALARSLGQQVSLVIFIRDSACHKSKHVVAGSGGGSFNFLLGECEGLRARRR